MDTFGMLLFFLGSLAFWVFLIMFIVRKVRRVDTGKSGLISIICIGASVVGLIIGVATSDGTSSQSAQNQIEVADSDVEISKEMPQLEVSDQLDKSSLTSNKYHTDPKKDSYADDTKNATSNVSEETDSDTKEQSTTEMVAKEKVNVREQPNTDCEILGKLSPGDSISVYESLSDGWSRVDYKGSEGYVKTEYLTAEKDYVASDDDIKAINSTEPSTQDSADSNSGAVTRDGSNFDTYDIPSQQNTSDTYVLNTKSKKIHHPSCNDVKKISPENYATTNSSVEVLISQGYDTCGHCF